MFYALIAAIRQAATSLMYTAGGSCESVYKSLLYQKLSKQRPVPHRHLELAPPLDPWKLLSLSLRICPQIEHADDLVLVSGIFGQFIHLTRKESSTTLDNTKELTRNCT